MRKILNEWGGGIYELEIGEKCILLEFRLEGKIIVN